MGILDAIFGNETIRDDRQSDDNTPIPEADVITIDPDKPIITSRKRPPIIFENGLN